MTSLSDRSHQEKCSKCNDMGDRTYMRRLPGKRSWLCPRHYELASRRVMPVVSDHLLNILRPRGD